jgi:signal transduction histidine kinase
MLNKLSKIVGVLKVENKQGDENLGGFTASDRDLLHIFAKQAASDIQSVNELQLARTNAILTERTRLLGALHDSMNDFHMGIMLEAELTRRQLLRSQLPQAQDSLERLITASHSVYIDLKSLLEDLGDPIPVLTSQGLEAALRRYASGALSQWIQLEVRGTLELLSVKQTINLFHIARGAISNSVKYAGLDSIPDRSISINLACDGHRVVLQVKDNGTGFDVDKARREQSRGLKRMYQLASEISAQFEIVSEESVGTVVVAIVSLSNEGAVA